MEIRFIGASKNVTGSCYLLKIANKNILIDYGMFQEINYMDHNYKKLPIDTNDIDIVILTHAHLDHCGLLPKLSQDNYKGQILCSPATSSLCAEILTDSAKIQENNLYFKNIQPLYNTKDAIKTISLLTPIAVNKPYKISNEVTLKLIPASHILGATSVYIQDHSESIIFSGDLGRVTPNIIKGFDKQISEEKPNVIVMESLYGNTIHESYESASKKLLNSIVQTMSRGGNVMIPVFSIQRHQEILHLLTNALKSGNLKKNVQIFSDSPLGYKIMRIYESHTDEMNYEFKKIHNPYGTNVQNMHFVHSNNKSMGLYKKSNAVIIAGSGMLNGGRILNHLRKLAGDKNSSLIIVGFQAEGTLGYEILKHPKTIKINSESIPLKLNIEEIYGFSAHADKNDLLWWLEKYSSENLKRIFLVHSEVDVANSFKEILVDKFGNNIKISIPDIGEQHSF
jgi:metallo-beta-lactamase family protein